MENNEEIVIEDTSNLETDGQESENADNEELDANALKAKLDETTQANRQLFERAKKAEGFVRLDGKWVKAPKNEDKSNTQDTAGDLDETQLDYLDLKGIGESEDIKVIEDIVKKTGMTVRQALKDEYVQSKLNTNKQAREVRGATPSATKRGGNQSNDIASAIAKFEQTGELPTDFTLRSAVVNATVSKSNSNKPSWH